MALTLLVLPVVAVMAWSAPVAQAHSAPPPTNAALLPSLPVSLPTPCLLNTLLCGHNLVQNPAPCLLGAVLCTPLPLPTPCLAGNVLCDGGGVVTQGGLLPPPLNGGGGGAGGGGGGGSGVPAAGAQQQPAARSGNAAGTGPSTSNSAPLAAPPGVGLVPPPAQVGAAGAPNPDPLAVLLSLSIRDGLTTSVDSIWPALAGIQVLLLLVIVAAICSRQLTTASVAPKQ